MSASLSSEVQEYDEVLVDIVDYVRDYKVSSDLAYTTARHCLIDTLGCGLEALEYPACTKLLGPVVPETIVPQGAKVPGTKFQLDQCWPPSTWARSYVGWILTTRGLPRSGGIRPITSEASSQLPTGFHAAR